MDLISITLPARARRATPRSKCERAAPRIIASCLQGTCPAVARLRFRRPRRSRARCDEDECVPAAPSSCLSSRMDPSELEVEATGAVRISILALMEKSARRQRVVFQTMKGHRTRTGLDLQTCRGPGEKDRR